MILHSYLVESRRCTSPKCNSYYLHQFRKDKSFKPQGGQLGENDMDYDTDEKSMATLRRHLRNAKDEYYRYKRFRDLSVAFVLICFRAYLYEENLSIQLSMLVFIQEFDSCYVSLGDVCSEYLTNVTEALTLEDTMKNYERCSSTGWSGFPKFCLSSNIRFSLFMFSV